MAWQPTNRRGRAAGRRLYRSRVLLAALELGRDFRPDELAVGSPFHAAEAVQWLYLDGQLDRVRQGSCRWTYRLTALGRSHAESLRRGRGQWQRARIAGPGGPG